MLARALSGAVLGIHAYLVTVEADVASGLPSFNTVGLPQGAVKEGRERVIAAVQNSGHIVPPKRITINLAPASGQTERIRHTLSARPPPAVPGAALRRWARSPASHHQPWRACVPQGARPSEDPNGARLNGPR
ncbi:MAG: hypothetical protein ICV87_02495 [Gemmatimonadetes bacterium]|nr:hypothetical protein [Gemmatimonadota bacterium]